jgi:hypothetical protein
MIAETRQSARRFTVQATITAVVFVVGAAIIERLTDGFVGWCARFLLSCVRSEYSLPAIALLGLTGLGTWAVRWRWSTRKQLAECAAEVVAAKTRASDLEAKLAIHQVGLTGQKEEFERFEEIVERGVRWAFVDFWPTAFLDRNTGRTRGLGLEIFNAVFDGIPKRKSNEIVTWDNMLTKLQAGLFDVVVTPLYETRDRKNVSFCLPLFYSDIGLFVRDKDQLLVSDLVAPMSYQQLIDWGAQFDASLPIEVIPGELHDRLCRKVFGKVRLADAPQGCTPDRLLDRLRTEDCSTHRLQFIERWQGERPHADEARLRNLLLPGELLFPVSFVVRSADDTLRRFINLRLLEVGDADGGRGIHHLLLASSNKLGLFENLPENERIARVAECFRRSMPRKLSPETLNTKTKHLDFHRDRPSAR